MRRFTPEGLAREDGQEGSNCLVAVDGKVYDLSSSRRWRSGRHMNRHKAGRELTADLKAAPHGPEVLDRFPVVGTFTDESPAGHTGTWAAVNAWLGKHPFFRRHPHPAAVHFPLALLLVSPLFQVAALLAGSYRTEWAAFLCLLVGTATVPAAMLTGYFTWWMNYEAGDSPIIKKKRVLAGVAFVLGLMALCVRTFFISNPLMISDQWLLVYMAAQLALAATISWVGFLGGSLTFPYEGQ